MTRRVSVAIAVLLGALSQVRADDVVYTPDNTPEDKSNIEVSGRAEMLGVDAFRHLWAWYRFDDAGNLLVNDVSGGPSLRPTTVGSTEECSESYFKQQDSGYRGSACQFYGNYTQALKLKTSELPDCICSGSGEFTISGWFRVDQSFTNAYVAIYYVGNLTNSNDNAQMRLLSNGNIPGRYVFDRGGTSSNWDDCWGAYGDWVNWTVVRTRSSKGAVIYNAYTNGVSLYMSSHAAGSVGKDLVSDDEGLLIGGALSNGTSKRFLRSGNLVDEVMIFDKALSDDEVVWVAEHTKPYEFSAGWTISDEGSLDLYGSLGHMIRGYGAVSVETGLSLTNDADAYFGGTIAASAGLTFDPSASTATQTLSGVSTYSGPTVVKGGTLLIQPPPQVPAALKDGLIGFWTFDDPKDYGRDLSGTGNHLYPSADVFSEPVPSEVPGGGRMMDFPFNTEEATTHRWVLQTKNVPIGLEGAATGDIGTNVSIVAWARPRPPFAVNRTGLFGFVNCKGPALSFANKLEAKTLTFGLRDVDGAGSWSAPESIVDSVHMFAVTYDVSLADTTDKDQVTKFYYDGEFKANKASYKSGIRGANGKFALGESVYAGSTSVCAFFDQAMLYNRPLTASEIEQLYAFGQHPVPTSATGVLPAATELAVSSGATAAFENANETVAAISGAGTIVLTVSAKLTVTGTVGFTGAATGAGKLALGDDLAWAVETDEKGCARAGKYTYFTVPAAMLEAYDTTGWTVTPAPRKSVADSVRVFAVDNGDGTVTFKANVPKSGLTILLR